MDVNLLVGFLIFAILVEAIVSYIKLIVVDKKAQWQVIVAAGISITMAIIFNMDLFALLGFTATIPIVGAIFSGLILARGSNYVFNLVKLIYNAIDKIKEVTKANGEAK